MVLGIAACQNHTEKSDSNQQKVYKRDTLSYEMKTFELRSKDCKKLPDSLCKAYVKAIYPVFDSSATKLNQWVDTLVAGHPLSVDTLKSDLKTMAANFLKEYSDFKKGYPDVPAGYEWDQELKIARQDTNIISFAHRNYIYTAGAHGLENVLYYNWDLHKKEILKLKDLLNNGYEKPLTAIAEQIFRQQEGVTPNEPLTSYFFKDAEFSLNDNFLITSKGLQFLYNPYEIKAYAAGKTILVVPYDRIEDLIGTDSYLSPYKYKALK